MEEIDNMENKNNKVVMTKDEYEKFLEARNTVMLIRALVYTAELMEAHDDLTVSNLMELIVNIGDDAVDTHNKIVRDKGLQDTSVDDIVVIDIVK